MKRNLRFYFALFFAKGTALALRLIGRKGTSMPGSWAIIICPDFLGRIKKPEKIIGITGTNGKTTVSNMIEDIMESQGESFICNREGSNVPTGIASSLIANSTIFGKPKKQLAVFEMDERSSVRIFPYLEPDILIVTNLFRDSYRRNAHTEFIFDILNEYVPKKTTLILNGDDPLCCQIAPQNNRLFFGMAQQDFESGEFKNIVRDGASCPRCAAALTYDFTRYHHIGICHCESCGYTFPKRDYLITHANRENHRMCLEIKGETHEMKLMDSNPINMYNQLSAVAVLTELGYSPQILKSSFDKMKITESRLMTTKVGEKTIVRYLAKGQNPVACSRAFDSAKDLPGKKCVILFLDDQYDAAKSVENIAWLYDTDFEFLCDESINRILVGGARHLDTYVRLLLAGVPSEKILHTEDQEQVISHIDFDFSDTFVIYHDIYLVGFSEKIKNALIEKVKEVKTNEN